MSTITTNPLKDGYDFYINDSWGKEYHFKIITFDVPSGKLSVAVENTVETNDYHPKKMEVLSDFAVDIESVELRLKTKNKKEINRKSLIENDDGSLEIKGNSLEGVVLADWDMDILFMHLSANYCAIKNPVSAYLQGFSSNCFCAWRRKRD